MGTLTYMILSYAPLEASADIRHSEQRTRKNPDSPFETRHFYSTTNPAAFKRLRQNSSVYWVKTVESSGISVALEDAINNFYERAQHITTCEVCWHNYDGVQWRMGKMLGKDSEYSEVKKERQVYEHSENPRLPIKAREKKKKQRQRITALNLKEI
jgi:hypothetical protein